jgi:hypothetical protein
MRVQDIDEKFMVLSGAVIVFNQRGQRIVIDGMVINGLRRSNYNPRTDAPDIVNS